MLHWLLWTQLWVQAGQLGHLHTSFCTDDMTVIVCALVVFLAWKLSESLFSSSTVRVGHYGLSFWVQADLELHLVFALVLVGVLVAWKLLSRCFHYYSRFILLNGCVPLITMDSALSPGWPFGPSTSFCTDDMTVIVSEVELWEKRSTTCRKNFKFSVW